ncbi:hypothetical protein LTR09_003385 [Extremus antarcticus]|uniref:Methyltransferase domain-containing protein n=1 Tax=Extremus antarcticus TaxID=702011 RepID=A0AAJ0DRE8_9PEZI|nr:hypothetical protein LTR09_003385 [Extremus antarcticus]
MANKSIYKTGDRKSDSYVFDGAKQDEVQGLERQSRCPSTMMHNAAFHAPVSHPLRILEVGCGTSLNTRHLGCLYPNARVIGTDPLTIPHIAAQPTNVEFIRGTLRPPRRLDPEPGERSRFRLHLPPHARPRRLRLASLPLPDQVYPQTRGLARGEGDGHSYAPLSPLAASRE